MCKYWQLWMVVAWGEWMTRYDKPVCTHWAYAGFRMDCLSRTPHTVRSNLTVIGQDTLNITLEQWVTLKTNVTQYTTHTFSLLKMFRIIISHSLILYIYIGGKFILKLNFIYLLLISCMQSLVLLMTHYWYGTSFMTYNKKKYIHHRNTF